jgi:mRNA interferase MazF
MHNFSKNDVILVRYPFSDMAASKIRPAVVVGVSPFLDDCLIVPLTSNTHDLHPGDFLLAEWHAAGLNVPTAAKRGIYTIHISLFLKSVGRLSLQDAKRLKQSLREWLDL